ncbi:MAG TPA: MmcQ/YjbR family DNA-binding protein [Solirubrobacteraceae bacterium]|nr:MmcQ/YjbR family DNA-binding protein [Solirubrobacteraceae bacterium]
MATWDDVDRLARSLPETEEGSSYGNRAWTVKGKAFAWERPLRKADLEALGDAAPDGPILGARVEHVVAKEALLADDPGVYFTTPHFDGYPAILVRLEEIGAAELEELLAEAWLARAPKRLAQAFLRGQAP